MSFYWNSSTLCMDATHTFNKIDDDNFYFRFDSLQVPEFWLEINMNSQQWEELNTNNEIFGHAKGRLIQNSKHTDIQYHMTRSTFKDYFIVCWDDNNPGTHFRSHILYNE